MDKDFDIDSAKNYLSKKDEDQKKADEFERLDVLHQVKELLKRYFLGTGVQVFLVGSLTRPFMFQKTSDIDIVLKNFNGDRFKVWSELESQVEIMIYEKCHFKNHIDSEGIKVN